MSTLVVGPWVGEFGYELFKWQAYARRIANEGEFTKVVVASREGHEYLYHDFCTEYRVHRSDINICEGRFNTVDTDVSALPQETFNDVAYMSFVDPGYKVTNDPQDFIKYGKRNTAVAAYDIVIHARNIDVANPEQMVEDHAIQKESRNWSRPKWMELACRFEAAGLAVCSIGAPSAAMHVPGTDDKRGISLEELADILASSLAIVGPSSGPMHFATLCGCPQAVWGSAHLEERYTDLWNPFKTPVEFFAVDDAWDPGVAAVESLTYECLRQGVAVA